MNSMLGMTNATPDTIHYTEEVIGLDRRLTVVGTVCDKMGNLQIESTSKHKVIVSTKSADDMAVDAKKELKSGNLMLMICAPLGIILLVLGIILL